jgi:hypothetical protein
MTLFIFRRCVLLNKVPPMCITAWAGIWVAPLIIGQIRMGEIYAAINYGNNC